VSDGRVAPQPDGREWNQEAKLTGRHAWQAFGREHPLQGGYECRSEKLQRGSLSVPDASRDISVLWGQHELSLTSRLTVTAGLRYDNYSDFGDEWSPKAEAVFTLAPEHRQPRPRPGGLGRLHLRLHLRGEEGAGRPTSASASPAWARMA
jgi:outer membrane receptor protein involved in Fe transport